MMALSLQITEQEYDLFIILEDENIARLHEHDSAEVVKAHFGSPWTERSIRNVVIMHASPEDKQQIQELTTASGIRAFLQNLARGFRYRPSQGDSDKPYKRRKVE